ncbi:MAG: hypothetical protein QXV17_05775 [Candidatus Micrarchaeaceae archaeon]
MEKGAIEPSTGVGGLLANIKIIQTRIKEFIGDDEEAIEIADKHKFIKKKKAEDLSFHTI